jgi:shikimate dehydrogenase
MSSAEALKLGLIGAHISRTRMPAAMQVMCAVEEIDLSFELIDTSAAPEFDFATQVEALRAAGWDGVSVTHPFKTQAAAYAGPDMDGATAHVGAANTLVFADGLTGLNTDFSGFLGCMAGLEARGPVVMMGAGGVARAVGFALASLGMRDIAIYDSDGARAEDLAFSIGPPARAIPSEGVADAVRQAEGLINCTPLGMAHCPGSAFAPGLLGGQRWAFEAVYTPVETEFLIAARAAGLDCITGFDLFRHMAVRSFAAYTGRVPDIPTTLRTLEALRP